MTNRTISREPIDECQHGRRPSGRCLVLALVTAQSLTAAAPAFAATRVHRVNITAANTTYSPTTIMLKKGQKVTFLLKNTDAIKHNLTVKGLKINADVNGGKTGVATLTLRVPGTYEFHCEYHPQQMKGTIIVT